MRSLKCSRQVSSLTMVINWSSTDPEHVCWEGSQFYDWQTRSGCWILRRAKERALRIAALTLIWGINIVDLYYGNINQTVKGQPPQPNSLTVQEAQTDAKGQSEALCNLHPIIGIPLAQDLQISSLIGSWCYENAQWPLRFLQMSAGEPLGLRIQTTSVWPILGAQKFGCQSMHRGNNSTYRMRAFHWLSQLWRPPPFFKISVEVEQFNGNQHHELLLLFFIWLIQRSDNKINEVWLKAKGQSSRTQGQALRPVAAPQLIGSFDGSP